MDYLANKDIDTIPNGASDNNANLDLYKADDRDNTDHVLEPVSGPSGGSGHAPRTRESAHRIFFSSVSRVEWVYGDSMNVLQGRKVNKHEILTSTLCLGHKIIQK